MHTWLVHPPRPALSGSARRWLTASGSLSERIRSRCGAGFRVEPLTQRRASAWLDERAALGLAAGVQPLVREVLLLCGETPVIFARSLTAARHLAGPWRSLRGLGSQPLATMLFSDPRITRGPLEFARIDNRASLYRRAAELLDTRLHDPTETLWARRSVFTSAGAPLLVSELFLPRLLSL